MTKVRATRFVDCPFSAVIEFAEESLRRRPDIRLAAAPALGEHANVTARLTDDTTDFSRKHEALLLAWQPRHAIFPRFEGALTVRPKRGGAWMRLRGTYEPPLGRLGGVFDALFGRAIARLTLRMLLREIGADVERRWSAFRRELTA